MQNGTMIQYFHWYTRGDGKHWDDIKNDAAHLADIGITAVWLPPASKSTSGGYSVGYDLYDLFDLGEFDQKGSIRTKYGTREQYLSAIRALHEAGLQVIVDVVLNHKGGGDEPEKVMAVKVNPDNRNETLSEPMEIEAFTKFTFPGRQKKYSDFIWTHQCFTGVDYAYNLDERGIFNLLNEHGDNWEEMIDDEKGNYDFLMYNDVEFRNPAVRDELSWWAKWYYDTVHFDGVRLDAVKHINLRFYNEWLLRLRHDAGKNIFAVGEYWAPGYLPLLLKYIEATSGSMSLFDSSLHHNFHNASNAGRDYDMRKIFNETLVQVNPLLAVTVVDNHDTQPLQALEAPVEHWFKPIAYALILLRQEGYPCIFLPDLYGTSYKDHGKDGKEYEIFLDRVDDLENLIKARKTNAFGRQRDYFDHGNCIAWIREGDGVNDGCAVILSNGDGGKKMMEIGRHYAGIKFIDHLGKADHEVVISSEGWGEFSCNAASVSVWVRKA